MTPIRSTLIFLAIISVPVVVVLGQGRSQLAEYVGRYTDGKDQVVYFEQSKYGLTIRPVLWTATQLLRSSRPDHFEVVDRTSRTASFFRDRSGKVVGVQIQGMDGEGSDLRKNNVSRLPFESLLAGRAISAANEFRRQGRPGLEAAMDAAKKVFERFPTKRLFVVKFLDGLKSQLGQDPNYFCLLGYALVSIGDRTRAKASFLAAYNLDPNNDDTLSGLARLDALPSDFRSRQNSWQLPFPLSDVFQRPTTVEIQAVERDWQNRNLVPTVIHEEKRGEITIDNWKANIKIISYLIHGSINYGAVIVPKHAEAHCCPVIVDAKGVSPTYFALEPDRAESIRTMDDLKDRFIYVIPSFRGEVLKFDGVSYRSQGDRRDALDGATDDAISFLSAALKMTPEADATRICAFGHSRGGTVAMLSGIRDKRIDCVVNVAGPTDWFYAMGTEGWTEQELWNEGVRIHATPLETGGQDLERFMGRVFDGDATLEEVRHNMIASSPLYFAKRLPLSQHHYGLEDTSVPERNGRELTRVLEKNPRNKFAAYFYPDQGHDTDRIKEPRLAKAFIAKALGVR